MARTKAFGRLREAIDPDDFRGGFGVWSGTSFSAPLLAGRCAEEMRTAMADGDDVASAVDRAWTAVEEADDDHAMMGGC